MGGGCFYVTVKLIDYTNENFYNPGDETSGEYYRDNYYALSLLVFLDRTLPGTLEFSQSDRSWHSCFA